MCPGHGGDRHNHADSRSVVRSAGVSLRPRGQGTHGRVGEPASEGFGAVSFQEGQDTETWEIGGWWESRGGSGCEDRCGQWGRKALYVGPVSLSVVRWVMGAPDGY